MVLALVGVFNGVSPTRALMPLPVQPFLADADGGLENTKLGLINQKNYTITNIERGSRTTLPWIYSGPGFGLEVDKNMDVDLPLGDVFSYVDALCDSANPEDVDILEQLAGDACPTLPTIKPLIWYESTTAVEGTGSEFLKSLVPPYSWLARHSATITNICLYGTTPNGTSSVLNTVYTNVPFAPNGSAFTATTKLGGDPVIPLSDTCLDSPQSSTSVTTLYRAPALEGDSDRPCDTGAYECADAAINGVWTDNTVTLTPGEAAITKVVNSVNLNNGPEAGNFRAFWEVELTNPAIMNAGWSAAFVKTEEADGVLTKSVSTADPNTLTLQCTGGTGEGLVVIKKILWPIPTTKDTYADDNAFVFVVKVICGTDVGTLVDKEVIWIKPTGVKDLDPPTQNLGTINGSHLQLVIPQMITVTVDELKANHHTAAVDGKEWLVAEVSDVDGVAGPDLAVAWDKTSVRIDQGAPPETLAQCNNNTDDDADGKVNDGCPAVGLGIAAETTCNEAVCTDALPTPPWDLCDDDGDGFINDGCPAMTSAVVPDVLNCGSAACITYTVPEPPGQSDVTADLDVMCPSYTLPGLYFVVIKAIDVPVGTGIGESKPSDNAARKVIKVWCYASESAKLAADDGIEDANGLYARWTVFQSVGISSLQIAGDVRKSYKSPPSLVSDVGYVERIVDLQCYWLDNDGCFKDSGNLVPCNDDGNGYIDEKESWDDYDLEQLGGIEVVDEDGDCVMNAAFAQPSHPVDELDHPTVGADCAALPYSEAPHVVVNSIAADQDCDGLVDGVERAWGSNPQSNDSDGDGAKDFVEMFQQTNPLNPDTDGDGFKDAPVPYNTNNNPLNTAYDNCPGVANPDQANNDGNRIANGNIVGTWASNPNQDKMGDACDADDDNDGLPDTYEVTTALSNPFVLDSDGDTIQDGAEVIYKKNPMLNTSYPTWADATQQFYYRGCHHNLPPEGTYGGLWDQEYDPTDNDTEMDVDGDGILCGGSPGDPDSDNGTGTKTAGPLGYSDKVEAFRYGLGIANNDTDGDTCPDWVEITDLDGNRASNINDVYIVAALMVSGPFGLEKRLADLDMNLSVNINDVYAAAANSSVGRTGATCSGGETQPGGP